MVWFWFGLVSFGVGLVYFSFMFPMHRSLPGFSVVALFQNGLLLPTRLVLDLTGFQRPADECALKKGCVWIGPSPRISEHL